MNIIFLLDLYTEILDFEETKQEKIYDILFRINNSSYWDLIWVYGSELSTKRSAYETAEDVLDEIISFFTETENTCDDIGNDTELDCLVHSAAQNTSPDGRVELDMISIIVSADRHASSSIIGLFNSNDLLSVAKLQVFKIGFPSLNMLQKNLLVPQRGRRRKYKFKEDKFKSN